MPEARSDILPRKPMGRSRLTNGKGWLDGIDLRSSTARRYRDLVAQIASDCTGGAVANLSETKLQLIRRFSAACVLAEEMEARLAAGEQINISEHAQLSSTLVRLATRIGISRLSKNISPLPLDYAHDATSAADAADEGAT
jgi:hypothetical protein